MGRAGVRDMAAGAGGGGGGGDLEPRVSAATDNCCLAGEAGTAIGLRGPLMLLLLPLAATGRSGSLLMMESMLKLLDLAAGLGGDAAAAAAIAAVAAAEETSGWRCPNGEADDALAGDCLSVAATATGWGELAPPSLLPPLPLESVLSRCLLAEGEPFSRPCRSLFLGEMKCSWESPTTIAAEEEGGVEPRLMGLVDMARGRLMPGAAPISTFTLCMSGEMRVEETMVLEAEVASDLILASVGVMGSVLLDAAAAAAMAAAAELPPAWCMATGGRCGDSDSGRRPSRLEERSEVAEDAGDAADADDDDFDLCLEEFWDAEGLGMVAAVHVSVTGNSSLFTLVTPPEVVTPPERAWLGGGAGGGWEEARADLAAAAAAAAAALEAFLSEYDWMVTRGPDEAEGAFFLGGRSLRNLMIFSSLESLFILSMSMGLLRGLVVTACASIRIMMAPTTTASSQGRRRRRRSPLTLRRRLTMHGGGRSANASARRASSGSASRRSRRGTGCLARWCACAWPPTDRAPSCHGEGMEEASALLALSDTGDGGEKNQVFS